ncbi:hypothetical protein AB0G32_17760 [Streptomyces sp. NPDC023723]|uniref:hypothetical protein n=1 Tax=Streptomyces sp. NPDC023723 TaxID=3154323 RepID=UPI0034063DB3
MSMTHRGRRAGWLAAVALTATAAGLTGCSSESDSADGDKPSASDSSAASASASASASAPDAGSAAAADQSTPESTVAAWVAAVVKGETKDACLLMGEAASGSTPAQSGSEETCADNSTQGKQIQQSVAQFKESFTPDPPTTDPKVEVAEAAGAAADKAVFPADQVTIDGKTLEEVIVANSTGVDAGALDVKIEAGKLDDAWYVTNMDFNIG